MNLGKHFDNMHEHFVTPSFTQLKDFYKIDIELNVKIKCIKYNIKLDV